MVNTCVIEWIYVQMNWVFASALVATFIIAIYLDDDSIKNMVQP